MVTLAKKHHRKIINPPTTAEELTARLTNRQQEVLSLLTGGSSNKEIAITLGITPTTVKSHVARLLHSLGVSSRVEAAVLWTETISREGMKKTA